MKVTILMSTYNGQAYVAEQIASIQAQTFRNWKLLVRDDGSSDDTRAILAEIAEQDSRICLINPDQTENYGVIKSFYTLLKYEPADYYFFSDQDDVWLPYKMQVCLDGLQKLDDSQPNLVYTDLKVVDQDLKVLNPSMIRSQSHHANTCLVQELTENTVTGGTMAINKTLADKWTTLDNIIMHDWYLALLASALGNLVYIDQPTQLYRQHGTNVLGARTLSKRFQKWIRPHTLFRLYWDLIKATQTQAENLLAFDLSAKDREVVDSFIQVTAQPFFQRYQTLKTYGLRKNKNFHTFVFTSLITTKFAYKE